MPGPWFSRQLSGELETITVNAPGFTTDTDADGNPTRVAVADVELAEVDIQPVSGSKSLLPEAVRISADYQAFAQATAAARAALVAGRQITRGTGAVLTITYVADHGTHLVLALKGM
jgi:hypothetical protein